MRLEVGPSTPYLMDYTEARALMEHCQDRFERFDKPCKSCIYRSRSIAKSEGCMFSNCPRDWHGVYGLFYGG